MVRIPGEDSEKNVQLQDNLAKDMSEALGIPCTVYRATDYSAAVEAMRTGNAQLAELGPFSYVTARGAPGAQALVVRGNRETGVWWLHLAFCSKIRQRYRNLGGFAGKDVRLC